MLQSFADQAAIAIRNAGLFNDLEEALELQTATSEILELISANPGELGVVLDGVIDRAIDLIGAETGSMQLLHGDTVRMEVARGRATGWVGNEIPYQDFDELFPPEPSFHDDRWAEDYSEAPQLAEFFRSTGIRSTAQVPMRIDGEWIGQINLSRSEVRPFDSKQAAILQTFADQAAIAIRNAGLFNDLEEALQLQTATSEVLALISEHPGDLTQVLEGILAKAAGLCGGEAGSITMNGTEGTRYVASHGPAMEPYIGTTMSPGTTAPRELFNSGPGGVSHTDDMMAIADGHPYFEELTRVGRVRSYARATLTLDGATVGGLHMYRHEVRPFEEAELKALASFAEQASLAIANANLFNDLDAALERQTAMTDVLEAVSTARDRHPARVRHGCRPRRPARQCARRNRRPSRRRPTLGVLRRAWTFEPSASDNRFGRPGRSTTTCRRRGLRATQPEHRTGQRFQQRAIPQLPSLRASRRRTTLSSR